MLFENHSIPSHIYGREAGSATNKSTPEVNQEAKFMKGGNRRRTGGCKMRRGLE